MAKRILSAILVIIALGALYSAIILFETNIFPGNTTINGERFSYRNSEYIVNNLNKTIKHHNINIFNGEEKLATLNTTDCLNVEYNKHTIDEFLKDISIQERLLFFIYNFNYNIEPEIDVIDRKFDDVMKNIDNGDMPQNAYIKYDKKEEKFVIVPHTQGNQIDKEFAIEMIKVAALKGDDKVDISNAFVKAGILDDNESLNEQLEKLNNDFSYSINYTIGNGNSKFSVELKGKKLHDLYECDEFGIPYISSDDNYEINEKAVKAFLDSLKVSEDNIITAQAGNENVEEHIENDGMSSKDIIDKDAEFEWLYSTLKEAKNANRNLQ